MLSPCSNCLPPSALISSPFTTPNPTTKATSSAPTLLRPALLSSKMDALVGKLKAALDATGLPIDLVVVSDHGMVHVESHWITLDQFADLTGFDTAGDLLYGKTEEDRARVYNQLKKASSQFVVYRRKNVPANLNLQPESRAKAIQW